MKMDTMVEGNVEIRPKKRGRPFGKVYRDEPYFPRKVARIKNLYLEGENFSDIGREIGMSRAGVLYLFNRWIRPSLKPDQIRA
jgi:hypothetical protein